MCTSFFSSSAETQPLTAKKSNYHFEFKYPFSWATGAATVFNTAYAIANFIKPQINAYLETTLPKPLLIAIPFLVSALSAGVGELIRYRLNKKQTQASWKDVKTSPDTFSWVPSCTALLAELTPLLINNLLEFLENDAAEKMTHVLNFPIMPIGQALAGYGLGYVFSAIAKKIRFSIDEKQEKQRIASLGV